MKTRSTVLALLISLGGLAASNAATNILIISDNYNVAGSGSGFALGSGVNSGINPPTTRLTGITAPGLRYIKTSGAKADSAHSITANKFQIARVATDSSTISLSASGTGPFDFGAALSTLAATPGLKSVYDISITVSNGALANQRCSFALSSAQGTAGTWDFGVQLVHVNTSDTFYSIFKRVSANACGGAALNTLIGTVPYPTPATLLVRVTDAGAEPSTFNSQVQVSTNGGTTFFYDSLTDSELPSGFRFTAASRFIYWDVAGGAGPVTYDDFSINWLSGPTSGPRTWTGGGSDNNWSTAANWGGIAPSTGDSVIFAGTNRPANNNDLNGLTVPVLAFVNGGFSVGGNAFTNSGVVSNLAGINILTGELDFTSTATKLWSIASGSELQLNNTTAVEVNGDNATLGGGTLRLKGTMNIGVANPSANPAFVINEGQHIVDGGTFTSRGGYRIASVATGPGALTVISNGGTMNLIVSGANLRVGDSANPNSSRLILNNGMLNMAGGNLAIPYAAGATGEVWQTGSRITGAIINFQQNGAGFGVYGITNSTLEAIQIKKSNGSSTSRMYFDNAVLRTSPGASNIAFVSGLNIAEIENGGLTLDPSSDISVDQVLRGTGGVIKSNSATAVLTAVNTYTGLSYVQAGRLAFANVTNASSVQVATGAEFGVVVKTPGSSGSVPSLSFLGSSSKLNFDFATFGNPTAPMVQVGALSITGPVTVNIANGLQLNPGTITLLTYAGSISGGYNFSLGTLPDGVSATLVNNSANHSIDLNITAVRGFRWTGAVDNNWDTSTQNWINEENNQPSAYSDGFAAEFLDGAANSNINVPGFPSPSIIVVSNNTLPYAWTGGAITTPIIRKNGPGSVTRNEMGADAVTSIELNDGSFIVNNGSDMNFQTILTDTTPVAGKFIKLDPTTLTVKSTNSSYDGSFIVGAGTVVISSDRSLGTASASIVISNGATLDLNDFQPGFEPLTVSGAGVGGNGAIVDNKAGTGVDANLRDVTLAGDTTFGAPTGARWDLRVRSGTGAGPGLKGNGFNLTKVGGGTVSIACQRDIGAGTPYWNMNLGDVFITSGSLAFAESLTLGNPSKGIYLSPGATVQFFDLGLTNPMPRAIFADNANFTCGGSAGDTNILTGTITLSGVNTIKPDAGAYILNGPIVGTASLNMSANDPGTVILNANNTFNGALTVTNGTLSGNGSLAGNLVMLAGTNAPGFAGVGTFTVGGNASLAGTTLMEINRNLSPNSDRLVVNGTLSYGGVLRVVLAAGAPAPQGGDVYQLFNKGSGSSFSSVVLPALGAGQSWITTNLTVNGTISVVGSSTPPSITGVTVSGNNLIFSGTGGTQGSPYTVVSSTNVTLPLTNWTAVATNTFGPGGTFSVTNTINPALSKSFFSIRIP